MEIWQEEWHLHGQEYSERTLVNNLYWNVKLINGQWNEWIQWTENFKFLFIIVINCVFNFIIKAWSIIWPTIWKNGKRTSNLITFFRMKKSANLSRRLFPSCCWWVPDATGEVIRSGILTVPRCISENFFEYSILLITFVGKCWNLHDTRKDLACCCKLLGLRDDIRWQ